MVELRNNLGHAMASVQSCQTDIDCTCERIKLKWNIVHKSENWEKSSYSLGNFTMPYYSIHTSDQHHIIAHGHSRHTTQTGDAIVTAIGRALIGITVGQV